MDAIRAILRRSGQGRSLIRPQCTRSSQTNSDSSRQHTVPVVDSFLHLHTSQLAPASLSFQKGLSLTTTNFHRLLNLKMHPQLSKPKTAAFNCWRPAWLSNRSKETKFSLKTRFSTISPRLGLTTS